MKFVFDTGDDSESVVTEVSVLWLGTDDEDVDTVQLCLSTVHKRPGHDDESMGDSVILNRFDWAAIRSHIDELFGEDDK